MHWVVVAARTQLADIPSRRAIRRSHIEAPLGGRSSRVLPGQYYDAESGNHYNYFRDYSPIVGRYIESDPIGLRGGMGTFSYVLGNPLGLVDPVGLFGISTNCPNCSEGEQKKIQNEIDEKCKNLERIKNVALRACLKKRCETGKVLVDCKDIFCTHPRLNARGAYRCGGGTVKICFNNQAGPEGRGGTAIHEWAHSCNWAHGDGLGVPHDNGRDGYPRCNENQPIGSEQ